MNSHPAWRKRIIFHASFLGVLLSLSTSAAAQEGAAERVFSQPKATVENALKGMQANLAGRLPTLDGFADPAAHPLDQYQRGYFEVRAQVAPIPSGGSLVHVSAKITAWYTDSDGLHSGYQLLKSNGRIEADLLDLLADQLALNTAAPENAPSSSAPMPIPEAARKHTNSDVSAPQTPPPSTSISSQPESTAPASGNSPATDQGLMSAPSRNFPESGSFSSSLSQGLAQQATGALKTNLPKADSALEAEAHGLEEILKNQAHPNNLVAVKKSGTPVVATPSLTAKTLFLASMHDEFEMLDFNADWVHIRISGLSRGWVWRNSVEMPEGISDTVTHPAAGVAAADLFRVTREESAQFPGDWPSLRGKNVKIITVEKVDENAKTGGPQDKLAFSKYLLDKAYTELVAQKQDLAGIVLVFDSADGGMVAATMTAVQQWKTGNLSDAALWHNCFFDPPETFAVASSPAGQ
jgi:hypothetical protein